MAVRNFVKIHFRSALNLVRQIRVRDVAAIIYDFVALANMVI